MTELATNIINNFLVATLAVLAIFLFVVAFVAVVFLFIEIANEFFDWLIDGD